MDLTVTEVSTAHSDDHQAHNSPYFMQSKALICIRGINTCDIQDNRLRRRGAILEIKTSISIDDMPFYVLVHKVTERRIFLSLSWAKRRLKLACHALSIGGSLGPTDSQYSTAPK